MLADNRQATDSSMWGQECHRDKDKTNAELTSSFPRLSLRYRSAGREDPASPHEMRNTGTNDPTREPTGNGDDVRRIPRCELVCRLQVPRLPGSRRSSFCASKRATPSPDAMSPKGSSATPPTPGQLQLQLQLTSPLTNSGSINRDRAGWGTGQVCHLHAQPWKSSVFSADVRGSTQTSSSSVRSACPLWNSGSTFTCENVTLLPPLRNPTEHHTVLRVPHRSASLISPARFGIGPPAFTGRVRDVSSTLRPTLFSTLAFTCFRADNE